MSSASRPSLRGGATTATSSPRWTSRASAMTRPHTRDRRRISLTAAVRLRPVKPLNFQEHDRAARRTTGPTTAAWSCSRTTPRSAAGTMNPATFLRCLGPKPWKAGVRRAGDPADRRPLRREPVPLPALLPVPGDPQAGARGRARPLLRLARGARDRPRRSTTCASSRTTGSRPTLGAWGLGWEVWCDGMEVTQFTYFQQLGGLELDLDPGGDHLRPRAARDVPPGQARRRSTSSGRRASPGATSTARTSASGRPTTSRRRPSTCSMRHFDDHEAECRAPRRARAAAARLRPGAEVLARVQPARRARRDLRHRARRLHRPRPQPRARRRAALPRAGDRSCRRCCLRSAARSCPAAACREAERAAAGARAASSSAPSRPRSASGRGGSPFVVDDLPERTPDEWIKGPPVDAARAAPPPGSRRSTGVAVDELEERDGFLGVDACRARPLAEVLPERLARDRRGLAFAQDDALGRERAPLPAAGALAAARSSTARRSRCARRRPSGDTRTGHRFTHGEVEVPYADELPRDAARRRRRARPARAPPADRRGARRDRRLERPGSASSTRSSTSSSGRRVLEAAFDERFLQLPERVIVTAMQSHQRYFPLGGNRVRVRRERRRPGRRARRATSGCSRRGSRTRRSRSSATSRAGIEALAERARLDHVLRRARARSPTRRERLVELVDAARRRRGVARGGAAREGRPGGRARARVPRARGPHRRRVRAARRATRRRSCAAIDEQYLPDAADAPLPRDRGRAACSRPPTSSTSSSIAFGLGKRPTGSRDPYGLRRAAIGLCRLAIEGGRRDRPRACSRTTSGSSSRSGSRACSTCRSSSCARRGPRRRPTSAAWRALAQALYAARETPRVRRPSTRRTRARTGSRARPDGRGRPGRSPSAARGGRRARAGADARASVSVDGDVAGVARVGRASSRRSWSASSTRCS